MNCRNWMFTLNNPSDHIMKPNTWPDMKYVIWQVESGENGTPHWQGYIQFKTSHRLNWLKTRCSRTAHWEPRKGTHEQAVEYCSKSETRISGPFIFGDPPTPGKRTDLVELKQDLDEGLNLRQIASNHFAPYIKYARGIQSYRRLMSSPRNFKTTVTVLYGDTGVGKSKLMQTFAPLAYWKTTGDKWWDDYDFQDEVVIDEFYGWLPYAYLLRLLDRYPMYVETKGGMVNFTAKHIYLAANNPPDLWYNWSDKMRFDPLDRRIDNLLLVEPDAKVTVLKGINPFEVPEIGINDLYSDERLDAADSLLSLSTGSNNSSVDDSQKTVKIDYSSDEEIPMDIGDSGRESSDESDDDSSDDGTSSRFFLGI